MQPMLAYYVGNDTEAADALSRMVTLAGPVSFVHQEAGRAPAGASLAIVDCRKRSPGMPQAHAEAAIRLALVDERSLHRPVLYSSGFFDYLSWPLVAGEVRARLRGCLAALEQKHPARRYAADPVVQRACEVLDRHIDAQMTLADLARHVGTNRTTLAQRFAEALGCGPMSWLRRHRMEAAARLLREGRVNIVEIALAVGYENANNFATAFKAVHGLSPRDYRKLPKQEKTLP